MQEDRRLQTDSCSFAKLEKTVLKILFSKHLSEKFVDIDRKPRSMLYLYDS